MSTQQEPQGFTIDIAGKQTVVRLDAFDGRDTKLCRGETGHAPQYWFQRTDEWDIDIIAMFVWLTRRKLQPTLAYDDVLESISYDNFKVVQAEAGEDGPEA